MAATDFGAERDASLASRSNELFGTGTGNNITASLFDPPNLLPTVAEPRLSGNPTKINVDTKAIYLIETANYNDFIILNGGVRFDDYTISANTGAQSNGNHSGMFNYNVGGVVKPLPYASVYAAYATSSNPVGAELDTDITAAFGHAG